MSPKRVLLDENLSPKLRQQLADHLVITTQYQGWAGKKNGELIALAESDGFDVLVTRDRNLAYQQNLKRRRLALVEVIVENSARRNRAGQNSHSKQGRIILANGELILAAINAVKPNDYVEVVIVPPTS